MSDPKDGGKQKPQDSERELATATFNIRNRRYYVDVKENPQGRFIKITESTISGQKARIFMSAAAAREFIEKLEEVKQILADEQAGTPARRLNPDGLLKSYTIIKDSRRYFLDLKDNKRMYFLRISMLSNGTRTNVIIPSEGLKFIQETITKMLDEYFSVADEEAGKSRLLQSGNMTIYFDLGSNYNGTYLRISELCGNSRNSIVIREQDLIRFREILNEIIESRSTTSLENNEATKVENNCEGPENPEQDAVKDSE